MSPTGPAARGRRTVRPLAELASGATGRVVGLRLAPGERHLRSSPLQPGTAVYVVEAAGGGWLHVRIGFREYPVPTDLAERVLVAADGDGPGPGPRAAVVYAVLVSRRDRESWRVRVVERAGGTVAYNETFDAEEDARRRWETISHDAATLDMAAFRGRYGLP